MVLSVLYETSTFKSVKVELDNIEKIFAGNNCNKLILTPIKSGFFVKYNCTVPSWNCFCI